MAYETRDGAQELAQAHPDPAAIRAMWRHGNAFRGLRARMENAPIHVPFAGYLLVGGVCGICNILAFLALTVVMPVAAAAPAAFLLAAILNYYLCLLLLFQHRIRWSRSSEWFAYALVVASRVP